jgi:hypothetical protein
MADLSDERRDKIHALLQELGVPIDDDDQAAGALLTGWALVMSWADTRGEVWLTKAHAATLAHWAANGMHHEALYGDWPTE